MKDLKPVQQCKTCPWRVGASVEDIPRYSRSRHEGLHDTIQSGVETLTQPLKIMACHYSEAGAEFPCAGWLNNQLGPGNNIALRLAVARGQVAPPAVDGPQVPTFADTLCARPS